MPGHIGSIGFYRRDNTRKRAERDQRRRSPEHDGVEFKRIQHNAGLRANDRRRARHDGPIESTNATNMPKAEIAAASSMIAPKMMRRRAPSARRIAISRRRSFIEL